MAPSAIPESRHGPPQSPDLRQSVHYPARPMPVQADPVADSGRPGSGTTNPENFVIECRGDREQSWCARLHAPPASSRIDDAIAEPAAGTPPRAALQTGPRKALGTSSSSTTEV